MQLPAIERPALRPGLRQVNLGNQGKKLSQPLQRQMHMMWHCQTPSLVLSHKISWLQYRVKVFALGSRTMTQRKWGGEDEL